jgi:16S rRNA (cytidine1402-2'-O)-methyltransferase
MSDNQDATCDIQESEVDGDDDGGTYVGGEIAPGTLVLVATPIGNLADLSPRAASVLRMADAIACEDTRHTRKLLSAQGIGGKRLLAVHEHNELDAAHGLVKLLEQGLVVALVTDAGTPGISDPGSRVVGLVVEAGREVVAVPGPAAFVSALIVSGLPTERFVFDGFLPRSGAARTEALAEIASSSRTTIMYEAPGRVVKTLQDLRLVCGSHRRASASRELTKRFEETKRGSLEDLCDYFSANEPRGEFVLVIGPAPSESASDLSDQTLKDMVARYVASGMRRSEAVTVVATQTGQPKKRIYNLALQPAKEP